MINEETRRKRQQSQGKITDAEISVASKENPLEYHTKLICIAFEGSNQKILTDLITFAETRIYCRRIKVPYVNDVAIIATGTTDINVPNGYEQIPVNLNVANLNKELKLLRKSGKKQEKND